MIAFFDSSALIYLIEGNEPFASQVRAELEALALAHPDIGAAVSRLSWLECRVGPMKTNNAATLAAFDAFFARSDLTWVELSRSVVELATAIRARHGLRTADALQAASCLQLGSGYVLLTGDAAFRRVEKLNVSVLSG